MHKLYVIFLLISIFQDSFCQEANGFLHGKITLKNNKSYTGQIRWENRAGAWDDLFEAYKNEPQIQERINIEGFEKNDEQSEVFELGFMKLWENKDTKSSFAFRCQFGHIDRITNIRDNKTASIVFKNGQQLNYHLKQK